MSLLPNSIRTVVRNLALAALACTLLVPALAWAGQETPVHDNEAGTIDGAGFAVDGFSRAQVGSNRSINGSYQGYAFYTANETGRLATVVVNDTAYVHYDANAATQASFDGTSPEDQESLKSLLCSLDKANSKGGTLLSSLSSWRFTADDEIVVGTTRICFDKELKTGQFYTVVVGTDGSDISAKSSPNHVEIGFCDTAKLLPASAVHVEGQATGIEALVQFVSQVNLSPLWVTLKTSLTAIVIVFILGLLAAYFTMRIPDRAKDVFDSIFTIPLVLPPTVCGFLLLLALSRNTAVGQWFIDIGFPLVFSWQATVIAAVVVAFPLMYRSARGAFESLDTNMLDAARTLGWSEPRIFFKLMLPLAWSNIASGTVLAFARALGEFGATLFLAGNYVGVTRTIPIAIYFEWINGNIEVAIFWTIVIIAFSFLVILFINLWGRRTTKYRRPEVNQ
ncbi:MAG: molybdate ABC transporter permease subunit [Coriobacteriia bacterium]|nr:molybdate ABC transporter permease subunit [Coriobacteriia bacterium]